MSWRETAAPSNNSIEFRGLDTWDLVPLRGIDEQAEHRYEFRGIAAAEPLRPLGAYPVSNLQVGPPPAGDLNPFRGPVNVERELELLNERMKEFETQRLAHEAAIRTVIDQAFSNRGSNINDFVALGGTLEVLTFGAKDYEGVSESGIALNSAEFDFEIAVNPWTLGSIIIAYEDGQNVLFPTVSNDQAFGIDRFNVDTAFVTFGNAQEFWLLATLGRVVVPFGISTGAAKGDVLNNVNPLTVEIFETKQDVVMLSFEWPTPPRRPPSALPWTMPAPTPARPLVLNPLVRSFARHVGYQPLPRVPMPAPAPVPVPPTPPPFFGSFYVYNGNSEFLRTGNDHIHNIGGSLGYRTQGKFPHRVPIIFPYHNSPWSIDATVDFNSSVFDSLFLEFEYRRFLPQFDDVPGMAANIKSTFGPFSLILEWNGALSHAEFFDETPDGMGGIVPGNAIRINPEAWQVTLGYQFDWNPGITEIGVQGTYFSIGYSQSTDMAGVNRVVAGDDDRIGFVPRSRFTVGVGEWVLDGVRIAVDYSYDQDYSTGEGTGKSAQGIFGLLTYEW